MHSGIERHVNRSLWCGLAIAAAGAGCATRTDDGAAPVSVAVGAVESAPAAATPGAATAGIPIVLTRPASVPAHFVATPNGWFDPACVIALAANERVTADGAVVRSDGTISRPARQCPSPRYDMQGRIVTDASAKSGPSGEASTPTVNGWIEDLESTALGAMSFVHAQWTVPPNPISNTGQVVYFFPGLENASTGATILQPVLGWNQAEGPSGWSLASWHCCATGTTWHSTYLATSPGTTVSGDMTGTSCNSSTGVCSNWTITSSNPSGQGVTLTTTTNEAMNWLFGGVLEAYFIDTCNELPDGLSTTFSGFSFRNASGTTVGTPAWSPRLLAVSPSCSYAVSQTPTTATVSWVAIPQVCTPFTSRSCCPFSGGCGCLGEQICAADGGSWGSCDGAAPRCHECP